MQQSVTWKIAGEAGFGIMSAGTMLSKAFARAGYHTLATNEYPSLIRGGHNIITVRISPQKFECLDKNVHILVALNKDTVSIHKDELSPGALVIFDPKDYAWQASEVPGSVKLLPVPFSELVAKLNGSQVMRNTVAMGASLAVMGAPFDLLLAVIKDQFGRKGEEVVHENEAIARAGYDYVTEHYANETEMYVDKAEFKEDQLIINASEALGVGAVRAGVKFAAIYPMTPINALITYLADHAKKFGIVYKQPEDEIAGINMAVGASISGLRSMVATSGGGFALMVEGLSLAGMIEAPLVVDLGMRVGPATGMPTWTEQGELQFAIHAGHGEFPRIVLAPADAAEAYDVATQAFNLAEKFQIQVIILSDKYMNESQWCVPKSHFTRDVTIDRGKLLSDEDLAKMTDFKRYDVSVKDGVSPRSVPGQKGGFYINTSYEHNEYGLVTEDPKKRQVMADKRLRKFAAIEKDIQGPKVYGDADAEYTFMTWGSTRGPVLEAMNMLKGSGKSVRLIHFTWLYPFPTQAVKDLLASSKRVIDVEQNATGQLAALVREHTSYDITEKLLKYDGRPFFPEEIFDKYK